MKQDRTAAVAVMAALQIGWVGISPARAAGYGPSLHQETSVYLSLDELVTSKGDGDGIGTPVRCRVWRDVESEGVVYLKAGTAAMCRVDKVSRHHVGGFQGKVSVSAVETTSTDGQTVTLAGGYGKEGSDHKVVVLGVGLLLFWPALFFSGGNAELPPGTVFNAYTVNDLTLRDQEGSPQTRAVDLRGFAGSAGTAGAVNAEFMLDDFVAQPKHEQFRIKVSKASELPGNLVIDNVNGKMIDAIPLSIRNVRSTGGEISGVAETQTKAIAKYFVKGINRFDVTYVDRGQRQSTEVIMNVQM